MLSLIIFIAVVAGMWKSFQKAGLEGWKAIIPIYNLYVIIVYLAKKDWWFLILLFIPIVNFFAIIKINYEVARNFKISSPLPFALGLSFVPFIFYPILGFGASTFSQEEIID